MVNNFLFVISTATKKQLTIFPPCFSSVLRDVSSVGWKNEVSIIAFFKQKSKVRPFKALKQSEIETDIDPDR